MPTTTDSTFLSVLLLTAVVPFVVLSHGTYPAAETLSSGSNRLQKIQVPEYGACFNNQLMNEGKLCFLLRLCFCRSFLIIAIVLLSTL